MIMFKYTNFLYFQFKCKNKKRLKQTKVEGWNTEINDYVKPYQLSLFSNKMLKQSDALLCSRIFACY